MQDDQLIEIMVKAGRLWCSQTVLGNKIFLVSPLAAIVEVDAVVEHHLAGSSSPCAGGRLGWVRQKKQIRR